MPDPSDLAHAADRFMRRLEAGLHARAEPADTFKVGPLGGMVLLALADLQPAPITALVRELSRDKSQMTRVVKSLEAKGLIIRRAAEDDARVSLLELTQSGVGMVHLLRGIFADVMGEILAPLDHEEQASFARLLLKL